MKLKQQYPVRIRQIITHINNQLDYFNGTQNEEMALLQEIILSQQSLLHCILADVYPPVDIPKEPVGIWAPNMDFYKWFEESGDILEDMVAGEIVIVRDSLYLGICPVDISTPTASSGEIVIVRDSLYLGASMLTPSHMNHRHADKQIRVCIEDSPTSPNHFRQFDGTIAEHIQIIDNFLKTTGA